MRKEYEKLLASQKEKYYESTDKYSYKEVCFPHIILCMLRRHHLLPQNQKTNRIGCTSSNCSIIKSLIQQHSIYKAISMKSLRLSFSTKTAAMAGRFEYFNLYQFTTDRITQNQMPKIDGRGNWMIHTADYNKRSCVHFELWASELFFCLNENPYIATSAGLRRDRCLGVKISEEDKQSIPTVDVE